MRIKAVGFDIDGTLYPNYRFWARVFPYLLRDLRLLLSMGDARADLRGSPREGAFYELQAELAARRLKRHPREVRELLEERIYRTWEPVFSRVRPYAGVKEEILALKAAGIGVGVLSDFPIGTKLERMGLAGIWDAEICSEEVGRLKPAPEPFIALAEALGAGPAEMAYVGNSEGYDVAGARSVGMRAVLVAPRGSRRSRAELVVGSFPGLASRILSFR